MHHRVDQGSGLSSGVSIGGTTREGSRSGELAPLPPCATFSLSGGSPPPRQDWMQTCVVVESIKVHESNILCVIACDWLLCPVQCGLSGVHSSAISFQLGDQQLQVDVRSPLSASVASAMLRCDQFAPGRRCVDTTLNLTPT